MSRPEPAERGRVPVLDAVVLTLLALGLRLVNLDHTPHVDELYHVLVADSILAGKGLMIDTVPYERAGLYSHLVALCFRLFGEGLVAARLPAVVCGTALVTLLFCWVARVGGRGAAWVSGLLLCLAPEALYLSQLARFYALQALLFLVAAVAVERIVAAPARVDRGLVLGAAATGALLLGQHLQSTTAIGAAGLALWIGGAVAVASRRWVMSRRAHQAAAAAILLVGIALAVVILQTESLARTFTEFRTSDLWVRAASDSWFYYHWFLVEQYPVVWLLFPVWALLACARAPRAGTLAATVFAVSLVACSIGAWKNTRYLFFALPLLFATFGLGVAVAFPALRAALQRGLERAGLPHRLAAAMPAVLVAAGVTSLLATQGFAYTRDMVLRDDARWTLEERYRGEPDWAAAAERLLPLPEDEVVVSSVPPKALYFLGRLDYALGRDAVFAMFEGELEEFNVRDESLGRPGVSTVASLQALMRCHARGLVVADAHHVGSRYKLSPEVTRFLRERTGRVELPSESRVVAFRWHREGGAEPCDSRIP